MSSRVLASIVDLLQESNTHVKLPVYAMRHLNQDMRYLGNTEPIQENDVQY